MLSRISAAAIAFAALAVGGPAGSSSAVADDIAGPPPIFVGGRLVHEPAVYNRGHLLVPVRGVFEALGASVQYTPPRIVVVRKGDMVIAGLLVGRTDAVVRNRPRRLAVPPIRRGDHLYVPLRFVAEIAGASVMYSSHPRMVDIRGLADFQATDDERAGASGRLADTVTSPDNATPMWAFGLVGMLVTALAVESGRRLTETLRAKRSDLSR